MAIDWCLTEKLCGSSFPSLNSVNYKIGNEKLVRVLENASSHLRGLLDKQGRAGARCGSR